MIWRADQQRQREDWERDSGWLADIGALVFCAFCLGFSLVMMWLVTL